MSTDFSNLASFEFLPLSEVKAKLSEQMRKILSKGKKIAITTNGRPTAVLLSYEDFLNLVCKMPQDLNDQPVRIIDYQEWKKGEREREKVRRSILNLFLMPKLSRKGQKSYKREKIDELNRRSQKRIREGR